MAVPKRGNNPARYEADSPDAATIFQPPPRSTRAAPWALRPDVARALAHWKKLSPKTEPDHPVFVDAAGEALRVRTNLYRDHVKAAGIDRAELFEGSATTKPTAIHALRALFVTEALARPARTFREARMPFLGELDRLLGFGQIDLKGTASGQRRAPKRLKSRLLVTRNRLGIQRAVASAGLEPALLSDADFKSAASTDSATRPWARVRLAKPGHSCTRASSACSTGSGIADKKS